MPAPHVIRTKSNNLILSFEGRRIRVVGDPDTPQWVAVDVCDILDLGNASQATAPLDDDQKGISIVDTPGGKQHLITVYESGLYELIIRSRKPAAKKFRKWITGQVLPSIRKFGVYPPPERPPFQPSLAPYTNRIAWVPEVRAQLEPGTWCIFIESAEIMIGLERLFGSANVEMAQYDLVDGSIGTRWARYRSDKPWAATHVRRYQYTFPAGDPRGTRTPYAYHLSELQYFKEWLHTEYMSVYFPIYLKNKYGPNEFQRMLPVFASMGVPISDGSVSNAMAARKPR